MVMGAEIETKLKSRFKRAALVTALAVNAVTLSSSFLIANRGMNGADSIGERETLFLAIPVAPIITAIDWGQNIYQSRGATPIGFLGDMAHKHAPAVIDGMLNATFTLAGAPGAWVGYSGGVVVGAFTPSTAPNQGPAVPAPH
jgi:hypothetical protein